MDPQELPKHESSPHVDVVWESVRQRDTASTLQEALTQLPSRERTALVLRELEGRSRREIGQVLQMKPRAVEVALRQARSRMRQGIERAELDRPPRDPLLHRKAPRRTLGVFPWAGALPLSKTAHCITAKMGQILHALRGNPELGGIHFATLVRGFADIAVSLLLMSGLHGPSHQLKRPGDPGAHNSGSLAVRRTAHQTAPVAASLESPLSIERNRAKQQELNQASVTELVDGVCESSSEAPAPPAQPIAAGSSEAAASGSAPCTGILQAPSSPTEQNVPDDPGVLSGDPGERHVGPTILPGSDSPGDQDIPEGSGVLSGSDSPGGPADSTKTPRLT